MKPNKYGEDYLETEIPLYLIPEHYEGKIDSVMPDVQKITQWIIDYVEENQAELVEMMEEVAAERASYDRWELSEAMKAFERRMA